MTFWWFNNKAHYMCIMSQSALLRLLREGNYKNKREEIYHWSLTWKPAENDYCKMTAEHFGIGESV